MKFVMLRCIYGCQKWIPDKILHRNDDPIFFSTFFFSMKKINLKMKKKNFFGKISENFNKNLKNFNEINYEISFEIFWKFSKKKIENIFFHFQN